MILKLNLDGVEKAATDNVTVAKIGRRDIIGLIGAGSRIDISYG